SGVQLSQLQDIAPAEREILWRCARAFDLRPVEDEQVKGGTFKGTATGARFTTGVSPGDDFNARGWEWEKSLTGWKEEEAKGKERRGRRGAGAGPTRTGGGARPRAFASARRTGGSC